MDGGESWHEVVGNPHITQGLPFNVTHCDGGSRATCAASAYVGESAYFNATTSAWENHLVARAGLYHSERISSFDAESVALCQAILFTVKFVNKLRFVRFKCKSFVRPQCKSRGGPHEATRFSGISSRSARRVLSLAARREALATSVPNNKKNTLEKVKDTFEVKAIGKFKGNIKGKIECQFQGNSTCK